ncbi:unnamed protein product [Strongylus vulgaris]|uniref:DEK C-terminal domain-containing protein n=1 Tax=Strongylus vulgaris TaxID=40348 RepID=A0A3P7J4T8_STRVU|nr:unnamed protein product [Strongylus vulgaris]
MSLNGDFCNGDVESTKGIDEEKLAGGDGHSQESNKSEVATAVSESLSVERLVIDDNLEEEAVESDGDVALDESEQTNSSAVKKIDASGEEGEKTSETELFADSASEEKDPPKNEDVRKFKQGSSEYKRRVEFLKGLNTKQLKQIKDILGLEDCGTAKDASVKVIMSFMMRPVDYRRDTPSAESSQTIKEPERKRAKKATMPDEVSCQIS